MQQERRKEREQKADSTSYRVKKVLAGSTRKKKPPPGNRSIDGSINHYHTAGVLYKCARDAGDWKVEFQSRGI